MFVVGDGDRKCEFREYLDGADHSGAYGVDPAILRGSGRDDGVSPRANEQTAGGGAEGSSSTGAAAAMRDPRAVAQGSGVVFQTAGLFLCLASCCVGSFFGLIQTPSRAALAEDAPRTVVEAWGAFAGHQKLAAISLFANVAGGLGALAAGIGMQHDRYGSPRLAVCVSLPMAVFHAFYVSWLLIRGPWSFSGMMPVLLTVTWSGMGLLAVLSVRAHRRHPPARGPERLPPGFKLPMTAGERAARELRGKP